jgi:RNA polymerase sigma-70 factor (ECF subfamily)
MPSEKPLTQLLLAWRGGNAEALDALIPVVYDHLHALAGRYMRQERDGHTLRATALVHEAYLALIDTDIDWQDRAHFFAVAARLMRRILVDHARSSSRAKRGGEAVHVPIEDATVISPANGGRMIELDEALTRLAAKDERKAQLIELFYFGGLSYEEAAAALNIAPVTVHRDLKLAKAWLYRELRGERVR